MPVAGEVTGAGTENFGVALKGMLLLFRPRLRKSNRTKGGRQENYDNLVHGLGARKVHIHLCDIDRHNTTYRLSQLCR